MLDARRPYRTSRLHGTIQINRSEREREKERERERMSAAAESEERGMRIPKKPLVITDGACAACNTFVKLLLARDTNETLAFASLQESLVQELLVERGIPLDFDTMVLIDAETGKAYTKSTAVLRTLSYLPFPWFLIQIFLLIPAFIRNFFYSWFAAYRITLFGSSEYCVRLTAKQRPRFLQYNKDLLTTASDQQKVK